MLFLVSRAWLASGWCREEFNLAHRLNKRLFGVVIEDLAVEDLPEDLAGTGRSSDWPPVAIMSCCPRSCRSRTRRCMSPFRPRACSGSSGRGGRPRCQDFALATGSDPNRPPYRGFRPLETDDAGIFFGRDGPIVKALDQLRGLRETAPRTLVILGASGAGKSSFLRAGLFPRLTRDDQDFLPLTVIRPERAAINGDTGLQSAKERVQGRQARDDAC